MGSFNGHGDAVLVDEPWLGHATPSVAIRSADLESGRSLAWARAEAERRGCDVEIVDLPVDQLLDGGADVVVLEHHDVLRLVQALNSPASSGPAQSAMIASVPDRWSPAPFLGRPVTVVVEYPGSCVETLRRAVEIAAAHQTSLRVLHTWCLPGGYDRLLAPRFGAEWEARVRWELETALSQCDPEASHVRVEIDVRHGRATEEALVAADSSELLLVAREDGSAAPFGSVVRSALYDAPCPVVLLPAG